MVLARTLTILVEVMDAVRVSNDYLDLIYLGDQLRGTVYKHSDTRSHLFLSDLSIHTTITTHSQILRDLNDRWSWILDEIEDDRQLLTVTTQH